jgi:ppGpp synthetase/RelA/SpoT-type nucleotidyltranferase
MTHLDDNDRLSLATSEALRGAGDVRKRLLLEMSTGTPSITDLAYAVKIRVKDDYRIAEKVKRKREIKDPDYDVPHLRDIVGLRIVTLYRLDAIAIVPILLERIFDNSGHDESTLFWDDPIEEVIMYSLNPIGDAQNLAGRLRPLFEARGLKLSVESKPSNYTSIHIVAWGRGKYREEYRNVPVEIQIRTAFEDVWGEIEHRLKYKRDDILDEDEEETHRSSVAPHLNVLATFIDGLAQYADQIKIQIDEPKERRIRSIKSRLAEAPLERLNGFDGIPKEIRDLVGEAVGLSRMCFDKSAHEDYPPARHAAAKRRINDDLAAVSARVASEPDLRDDIKKEILYVLDMERGLLLFEYGNGLAGRAGNEALVEASRIYSRIEAEFPDRGTVRYRMAKVLDALGDTRAAQNKLEQLIAGFDATDLPPHHWVRAAARRILGVLYWEEACLAGAPSHAGEEDPWPDDIKVQFGRAYEVTKEILTLEIEGEIDPNEVQGIPEDEKAINNLLFYSVELLVGEEADVDLPQFGYRRGDMFTYLDRMETSTSAGADDFRHLDTRRRAYRFLQDKGKAQDICQRLIQALEERHILKRPGGGREEEILRAAWETLEWAKSPD